MPFGLWKAPAMFQLMNKVLYSLSDCSSYLDDIVVYSDSWECHVQHFEAGLVEANLTVNLTKYELVRAAVTLVK